MVAFAEVFEYEAPSRPAPFGSAVAVAVADDGAPLSASMVGRSKQGRGSFTGYVADNESGYLFARSRMYSPTLGGFVSRDAMGYINGHGLYFAYFVPTSVDHSGYLKFPIATNMRPKVSDDSALRAFGRVRSQDGVVNKKYILATCEKVACEKIKDCFKYCPAAAVVTIPINIKVNKQAIISGDVPYDVKRKPSTLRATVAHELVHVAQIKAAIDKAMESLDSSCDPEPGVKNPTAKQKKNCEVGMEDKLMSAANQALVDYETEREKSENGVYTGSPFGVDANNRASDFLEQADQLINVGN